MQADWEERYKWKCALQAFVIMVVFFGALGLGVDWGFARKPSLPAVLTVTLIPQLSLPKPLPKARPKPPPKPTKATPPPAAKPVRQPTVATKPAVKPPPKTSVPPADIYLKQLEEDKKNQQQRDKARQQERVRLEEKARQEAEQLRAKLRDSGSRQKDLQKIEQQRIKREQKKEQQRQQQQQTEEARKKKQQTEKSQLAEDKRQRQKETEKERQATQAKLVAQQSELASAKEARAEYLQSLQEGYMNRIIGRIEDYLITPLSAKDVPNVLVVVEVYLDADGSIKGLPKVVESSGIADYDREAVRAVLQASPLPMPKDKDLLEEFGFLRLHIKPQ